MLHLLRMIVTLSLEKKSFFMSRASPYYFLRLVVQFEFRKCARVSPIENKNDVRFFSILFIFYLFIFFFPFFLFS